jgi:hypothetical protein
MQNTNGKTHCKAEVRRGQAGNCKAQLPGIFILCLRHQPYPQADQHQGGTKNRHGELKNRYQAYRIVIESEH